MKYLLFVNLLCLPFAGTAQGTRYYVSPASWGQNNGSSWADAFVNLHDALALAQAGDEVWVAEGTYYASTTGDRNARFEPTSGIALYGGFAGTELDLSERLPADHPTILDGDIGVAGDSIDNTYNLLYLFRPDSNTIVDGFVFRNAQADKPGVQNGNPGVSGSAVYIMAANGEAYPNFRSCTFEHNTAKYDGGAVYVNGSGSGSVAPMFLSCQFLNNSSLNGNGGGLARIGGSWVERIPDVSNCLFFKNYTKRRGGAIYFADTPRTDSFEVVHTLFVANSFDYISTIYQGADIQVAFPRFTSHSTLRVSNCKFISNFPSIVSDPDFFDAGNLLLKLDSVEFEGGGVGAVSFSWVQPEFNSIRFTNSGGVSISGQIISPGNIRNISIDHCNGVVMNFSSKMKAKNIFWTNCKSLESFYFKSYLPGENNSLDIENLVFANNKSDGNESDQGLRIICKQGLSSSKCRVTLKNISTFNNFINMDADTILMSNSIYLPNKPKFIRNFSYASYSKIENNLFSVPDTFTNLNWTIASNNLWSTDPQFISPDSNDFRLGPCSPAVNAGDNTVLTSGTDVLGNPRIQFGTVDIGAVEAGPLAFETPPVLTPSCPGAAAGTADVSGVAACPPVTYQWAQAPDIDTAFLSGLPPGPYTVTITDTKGRSVSLTVTIPVATPPSLQPVSIPVFCGDIIGGSATVIVAGDGAPNWFQWGNGLSDSLLTGLACGDFPVTVTDRYGCTAEASVSVSKQGSLEIAVDINPITCQGSADGSLTIVPQNGRPPFEWEWGGGWNGPTAGPLGPGNYTGTLTDALGCKLQWFLPLNEPDLIHFSSVITAASGAQQQDGSIWIDSISGGTGPYGVTWNTGATGWLLTGLLPGVYTATVTDHNGCSAEQTFTVSYQIGTGSPMQPLAGYSVFPSPFRHDIFVDAPLPGPFLFELFDVAGKVVFHKTSVNTAMEGSVYRFGLEDLPDGAYVWKISNKNGIQSGVVVKSGE